MKKILGSLALALAVAASALATTGSQMVCEKTGTVVDECCCVEKDGTMICTLTGEEVESCCCNPGC
jgi:hypothetical protein